MATTTEGRALLGQWAEALNSPFAKEYVLNAAGVGKLTLEEGAETANMAIEIVEKNPKLLAEGKSATHVFQEVTNDINAKSSNALVQGVAIDTKLFSNLKAIGDDLWQSPGGVIYGYDKKFGNTLNHTLAHMIPNLIKKNHTVFNIPKDKIIELIDEAWSIKGAYVAPDPRAYVVNMKRIIGTNGESAIRIVVKEPGTAEILTAYPVTIK